MPRGAEGDVLHLFTYSKNQLRQSVSVLISSWERLSAKSGRAKKQGEMGRVGNRFTLPPLIKPDMQFSRTLCAAAHNMRYVKAALMLR